MHVSAIVGGTPGGHGVRTSYVEYLPEGAWYLTKYRPPLLNWGTVDQAVAREDFDKLFGNGEGEEEGHT